jgi:hypothetical protein
MWRSASSSEGERTNVSGRPNRDSRPPRWPATLPRGETRGSGGLIGPLFAAVNAAVTLAVLATFPLQVCVCGRV